MSDINVRLEQDNSVVLKFKDIGDGTHALPTFAAAAGNSALSAGVDRSITATATSQTFIPANPARRKFYVKNDSAQDVWINTGTPAVANAGAGNIKLPANGSYFELADSTGDWRIITASGNANITAREF